MAKIVKLSVISFWLIMVALLVERHYLHPRAVIAVDAASEEGVRTGDDWTGIYQQGRKIGYSHTRISRESAAYHIAEESQIDILVLGSMQRVRTAIDSYTSRNFLLKYFSFHMDSPASSLDLRGAVVGKKLMLDITSAGQTRKETLPLADAPYLSPTIKPALLLLGLEPGKSYSFPLFNPATMSMDQASVSVESKEHIKVGDAEQTVYKLKETFQGLEAFSWMTEEGDVIREESPLGYVLIKETEAEAKKTDKSGPAVDIIKLVMIPSGRIENPSETKYLKARLDGAALDGFTLNGDGQRLDGSIVEIERSTSGQDYRLPYAGRDQTDQLKATTLIQSDDARIRTQASRILAGEHNAAAAAKKLNAWVYNALQKKPVVSIPSALEILEQKTGDCNEHTTLYTALARASGIPTRMAAGIVYLRDGFYYHAWPEVWLGQWVAVDPTFNQFPADATHIRFAVGGLDRQSVILRLVGKLKVDVSEYR